MKAAVRRSAVLLTVAAIGTVVWVNAGSLTPPVGSVAPTMKTLVEVEPRTNINLLPGGGTYKHGITQSGSYYLTADVVSTVAGEIGILVSADNVTIDLNGFAMIGAGGAGGAGIALNAAHTNLAVRNGTIRGWGGDGIDATSASNSQFQSLRLYGNAGGGLRSGAAAIVTGCNASQNGGDGFNIGNGCTVTGCLAEFNAGVGINITGNNSRIDENNAGSNGTGIASSGANNLIVRNAARLNTSADFAIVTGNDYGQIIGSPGANFVATNPWANFSGCPSGQTTCAGICVNTQTNVSNCGSCGNACPIAPNATPSCAGGNCSLVCNAGYGDCNINSVDGCEASVLSDVNNCGACGNICPTPANGTRTCTNGTCGVSCNPGFANCDNNSANGCEVNLNTSSSNCGACGNVCQAQGASTCGTTGTCQAGVCAKYPAGTVCTAASCTGGVFNPADQCNGAGTCVDSGSTLCSPYTCNGGGTGCLTTCTIDGNCVNTHYCSANACVAKKSTGQPCGGNNQCVSGVCTGGLCQ